MPGLEKLKEDVVASTVVHNGGGSSFDLSASYSSFRDENDDSTTTKKKSVLAASSDYKLFSSSSPSKMKKTQQQQQKRNNKMSKSFDTMTSNFNDDDEGNNNGDFSTIKNGKKSSPKPSSFAKKQKSSSSSLNNNNPTTLKNGGDSTTNGDAKISFKKKSTLNGKNKDDPFRFAGDGVDFKCKLIGFQEVDQPRGDQMCQEAIQTCKAIVKRKGEHKQRIILNISLEGLKIKDVVSGMVLHSFPVSKVSFIAKDTTDNRAFGFIYGASDHEHHFYAVKTEKTADSIVFSIRDMFQIVYEMKKKQVEQAKQSQTQKNGQEVIKNKSIDDDEEDHSSSPNGNQIPEANLLDLETELENLEQGMQNMKKWVFVPDDGNNAAVNGTNNQFSSSDTTSSTWATASLSSSALTELNNDPFADNMFTSSMNSFTSSAGNSVAKETFVPPPPSTNGHSRRSSSSAAVARSTLFGPSQQNGNGGGGDPFAVFDFSNENRAPASTAALNNGVSNLASPPRAADPFDTSHVMNVLATVNNGNAAHSVFTPVTNGRATSTLRPPASFFDAMTPQVSSTPVAPSSSSMKNRAAWSPPESSTDVATPPTLTKNLVHNAIGGEKSAVAIADDFLFASYAAGSDDHRRFPSVIAPPPSLLQQHLQNGYNSTQPTSLLASSDDFSPDRSVFSAGEQQSNYASICTSTSNSALMNNAMNDTNALRLSFLNSDHQVSSSIDWSSNQKSPANINCSEPTTNLQNHVTMMHGAKSASSLNPFNNVSNFDHRSSPVIGSNGFVSSPNYEYYYSNNDYRYSSPPTKVDPFAHLRQKPKTINELRGEKMTNGSTSVDQLESLVNGMHTNPAAFPAQPATANPGGAAPSIPPRNSPVNGQNRPTPPPLTGARHQNDSTLGAGGFLPPPPKHERGGGAFLKKSDPFNDDFFVRN